jgi:branched-chain amino acid transport system substrate-binding protein
MVFMGLFALAVNDEFHYPNYFGSTSGPEPKREFSRGFFAIALEQQPKPQTVALVGADAEFGRNAVDGARENLKETGLKIVYDRSYPPSTVDFSPIVRAIQATHPDIVFVASYPPDSAGLIRAANEVGLKTKLFGGGMIGPQAAALKTQLGPLLNGIVTYDLYVPEPTLKFPGIDAFLQKYQAKAASAGTDPLGYYLPPTAYANLQILAQAVTATAGLDQAKLGAYIHAHQFDTIVGPIRFGPEGNTVEPRTLTVQYQNIKTNDLDQFRRAGTQVILYPEGVRSGKLVYPYR